MEEESLDQQTIRLKRLAKLSTSNNSAINAIASPPSSSKTTPQPIKKELKLNDAPSNFSPKLSNDLLTKIPQKSTSPYDDFDFWSLGVIQNVLGISLNPNQNANGLFLESLYIELKDEFPTENGILKLSYSNALLDKIVFSRLSAPVASEEEKINVLEFMVRCWQSLQSHQKNLENNMTSQFVKDGRSHSDFIAYFLDLCVSYGGLAIQMPDMFPQPDTILMDSVGHLLEVLWNQEVVSSMFSSSSENVFNIPEEYLVRLSQRFGEDGFDEIFGSLLRKLSIKMQTQSFLGEYIKGIKLFCKLCKLKSVAMGIVTLPQFLPNISAARGYELTTIIGPLVRISIYPDDNPKVAENFFPDPYRQGQGDILSSMNTIRMALNSIINQLSDSVLTIIKASSTGKECMLNYIGEVIRLNPNRSKMQADKTTVSSDGFVMNLCGIALKLCEPFLDGPVFTKGHLVDLNYLLNCSEERYNQLNVHNSTKLNASEEESNKWWLEKRAIEKQTPNFISEIFMLCLYLQHIGTIRMMNSCNSQMREAQELQSHIERMEEEKKNGVGLWAAAGPMARAQDQVLNKLKDQFKKLISFKLIMDTQLQDQIFLERSLQLYNLLALYLCRTLLGEQANIRPLSVKNLIPSIEQFVERSFRYDDIQMFACQNDQGEDIEDHTRFITMLPEWMVEDIVDFHLYILRYCPQSLSIHDAFDEFMAFIILFLSKRCLVKNPYLRAKFVEVLFYFTSPFRNGNNGFQKPFESLSITFKYLLPSLMKIYIEVEQTGASTQFYEKFNIRYNISNVLKNLWSVEKHRIEFRKQSSNTEFFVRFVNLLNNDATYLLDEALTKLSEIHHIQNEMENPLIWSQKSQTEQQEISNKLKLYERQTSSTMGLGNETVNMLYYTTVEIKEPFLVPEVIDRLAAMLNYNLNSLVGPRCTELKVKNPEKYHFEPKKLLNDIVGIYINLYDPRFFQAISRDGRSYKKDLFSRAASIMGAEIFKKDELRVLLRLVDKVEEIIHADQAEEEALGEIPDEFLDPLMFTLMEDPVILPTSSITIDRSTIKSHLLSDTTDPFNRKPLSIDDVIPNLELKTKIESFKASRRR